MLFQLTAARRRLGFQRLRLFRLPKFQLTAARRRLGLRMCRLQPQKLFQLTAARRRLVSTVNAPNATCIFQLTAARRRLVCMSIESGAIRDFNSQPREGGWNDSSCGNSILGISTHSRAKAAGSLVSVVQYQFHNFNSQPREGGWQLGFRCPIPISQFQLTAARRRLVSSFSACSTAFRFQLTAARRRLAKSGSDLD